MQILRFPLPGIGIAPLIGQQTSDRLCKLRKFSEDAYRPQPLFVVEGGRAADHGACRDVPVGAALGSHDGAVADVAVSGDPDLTGEDHILTHNGRTREANL